jgi:alkanesulfonate monooxygenase SsuD/methylene tetrahydromethanopterin reductase-like flavin-dependent oxidoreductase (luciferase family)
MRIGVSLTSSFAVKDPRAGAQWMIERARAAREAGLDSLFVGDHHVTPGFYYQNVPILGRLLAEWSAAPAGCLFLLPLWNPVLVAEQVGTLAAIAKGRFIFQCGLGEDAQQFSGMGADLKLRPSTFEESFVAVQQLLRGETVSGVRRFSFGEARLALRPAEPVEYWIGARAEPAIDRAARLGDGWLAAPSITPDEARVQAAYYRERCAAHRRTPTAVAIRRDVYVGESDTEATTTAKPVLEGGHRGFRPAALVVGGVKKVIDDFRALAGAGYTDVIIRHIGVDHAKILGSYARLREVREALKDV